LTIPSNNDIEVFSYQDHGEEVQGKTRSLRQKEEVEEKTRR
jgi:hypothetical protein